VQDAAANAPLRKVNTNGAKATAPRTRRRRLFSGAGTPPTMTASSVSDDKPTGSLVTSGDGSGFIDAAPKGFSYPVRRLGLRNLASLSDASASLSFQASSPKTNDHHAFA
jgi:hypothetical protein